VYAKRSNIILGFHGCDQFVRDEVVSKKGVILKHSENNYDWLGNGVYFWENNYDEFDSVRGMFIEGSTLYPKSGFREKNHIQIAIRNPNCIKGFFIPRELDEKHQRP